MTRKSFAMFMVAGLAGLAALAAGLRPSSGPADAAAKQEALGPSIETTVVQHTKVVRKHVRGKRRSGSHAAAAAGGAAAASSGARGVSGVRTPAAYSPGTSERTETESSEHQSSAPRPTTSPSATGGNGGGEHGDEGEHESEHGDDDGGDGEDD